MARPPSTTTNDGQPDEPPGNRRRGEAGPDPVRARRATVARWTLLANRVGYLFLALAMALFVIAFVLGFSSTMAALVLATLVVSFVLLAPSIVLGYAVKAAERDDRERGY